LPALMVIGGLVSALFKCYRRGPGTFIVSAISIAALPIALQVSYVINDQAWPDVGRILSPHGYLLVSCVLIMFRELPAARIFVGSVSSLLAFMFFIGASQEANAATLKSTFDLAKVNRIVARIEGAVPDLYMRQHSIVVIGQLSLNSIHRMKRFANRLYGSQFATEPFINYRQTELLNFYLGKEMIVRPTADQRNLALHVAAARRPWPAPESVFLQGDIIVVLLDRYTAGAPVTWIVGQSSEPLVGKQD